MHVVLSGELPGPDQLLARSGEGRRGAVGGSRSRSLERVLYLGRCVCGLVGCAIVIVW